MGYRWEITATVEIVVDIEQMNEGDGDWAQVAQNLLGHTGAKVVDAHLSGEWEE